MLTIRRLLLQLQTVFREIKNSIVVSLSSNADSTPPENEIAMEKKFLSFKICIEQVENKGEDAEPILELYDRLSGCIGVFDGMGGAGGATYDFEGKSRTGAYIASNSAKKIAIEFFDRLRRKADSVSIDEAATKLTLLLKEKFKDLTEKFDSESSSKLKSSLIKRFPTTMAVISFNNVESLPESQEYICRSFWAGDSRCYLLSTDKGLQQISQDDIKSGGDALDNLTNDSPISNCVNADIDFSINYYQLKILGPVVFVTATDGCFGFIPTPAHFEYLLLEALASSEDSETWRQNLIAQFTKISGDDVSMSVVCCGWESFEGLKKDFVNRRCFITEEYIAPLNLVDGEVQEIEQEIQKVTSSKTELISKRNKLRLDLWLSYKNTYEVKREQEVIDGDRKAD